jgi:glycosyltransferase involved in cell wall biosynthesis
MKIALVNYSGGGLSGGCRKYLRQIVPLLREDPRVDELSIFVPPKIDLAACGPCLNWPETSPLHSISFIKRKLAAIKPDVVFIPNFWYLGSGKVPVVVMIRNMEMAALPFGRNSLIDHVRHVLRRTLAVRGCRKATRVIGVSDFVTSFLNAQWKIPSEKLDRVYHGITPAGDPSHFIQPAALKNGDPRPFVFTAGSIRTYRGLEDLLKAAADARVRRHGVRLVIAGGVDFGSQFYKRELDRLTDHTGLTSDLIYTGPLNESEMNWCYHHCRLFVMTSRIEACPNTALEAMAHGCRIVSTTNPPMPEFFREAADYYRAGVAEELAFRIDEAFSEPVSQRGLKTNRAMEIASEFTWKRTVNETLQSLERAISGNKSGWMDRGTSTSGIAKFTQRLI